MKARVGYAEMIYLIMAALIALHTIPAKAATNSELRDFVKAGVSRANKSIHSFKGTVTRTEYVLDNGKEKNTKAKLTGAFDGKRIRISEVAISGSSMRFEGLFDGTNSTEWITTHDISSRIPASVRPGLKGLVKSEFRIAFDPRVDETSLLDFIDSANVVAREKFDGADCIVLEIVRPKVVNNDTSSKAKYWVAVDRGFMIQKVEVVVVFESTGKTLARQENRTKLKEYSDGLWGPAKHTETYYDSEGNKITESGLTYESDFRFNIPICESDFQLRIPSGIEIYNELSGELSTVP